MGSIYSAISSYENFSNLCHVLPPPCLHSIKGCLSWYNEIGVSVSCKVLIKSSSALPILSRKIKHNHFLPDSNEIRTHNHLVCKRQLKHLAKLASLAKWLSVRLRTKWLWVRILLLSLKLQIWRLFRLRSSLTFRQL